MYLPRTRSSIEPVETDEVGASEGGSVCARLRSCRYFDSRAEEAEDEESNHSCSMKSR